MNLIFRLFIHYQRIMMIHYIVYHLPYKKFFMIFNLWGCPAFCGIFAADDAHQCHHDDPAH